MAPDPTTRRSTWRTLGSLMMLVVLVALGLALYRYVSEAEDHHGLERLILLHVVALGVLIPLATICGFVWLASDRPDRDRRGVLTVVVGALVWVFVLGSLIFWFIMMMIGESGR